MIEKILKNNEKRLKIVPVSEGKDKCCATRTSMTEPCSLQPPPQFKSTHSEAKPVFLNCDQMTSSLSPRGNRVNVGVWGKLRAWDEVVNHNQGEPQKENKVGKGPQEEKG